MNRDDLVTAAKFMAATSRRLERSDWERHRASLLRHIEQGDDPLSFTRWSTIQATMFVGDVPFVRAEFKEITGDKDILRWMDAMRDSTFGNPERFEPDRRFTPSSVHQAYHLRVWERATSKRVENLQGIVEFGGGYGQMCAIAHRLGFCGEYTLFDFPEFLLLQRFYLENIGLPQESVERIHYMEVDSEDRFELPPEETDLLIACYSLCEASEVLQTAFFDVVAPRSCLIATHDSWGRLDLHKFYDQFMRSRNRDYIWKKKENRNIPGHFYVIGERKVERHIF